MKFPHDVKGWLTEEEGRFLARIAEGKTVLEIGSYCGRSTVCLAQTAARIHVCDTFDGRGTPEPRDTLDEFTRNVAPYFNKIAIHVGPSSELQLTEKVDLAFIDGAHDYASAKRDYKVALSAIKAGALVAFHDCHKDQRFTCDAGVTDLVAELIKECSAALVDRAGTIAVVKPLRRILSDSGEPVIAIAMPARDPWVCREALLAMEYPVSRPTKLVGIYMPPCPLLNHSFNQHWAEALNARETQGVTHFAMIHNDVCPEPGWLTTLYDELVAQDADIVSAVIPLKDDTGLTSTAIYEGDPWHRRRLTLAEIAKLPETFGSSEQLEGTHYLPLLANTGLWICDLRKDWCDEWCFHSEERIITRDGRRIAEVLPEDWAFSHWLNQRGAKIYATSKVKVLHVGTHAFTSRTPWGAWNTDEESTLMQEAAA